MKYLQKTSILSMSDMIVNTYNQNVENAQLIFNDLLETEYMLLADLIKHANSTDPTGLSLCDLLNEGIKRLCNDIIDNPNILKKNYFDEVDEYIQGLHKYSSFSDAFFSLLLNSFIQFFQMNVTKKCV